jgi:hypothetical protein
LDIWANGRIPLDRPQIASIEMAGSGLVGLSARKPDWKLLHRLAGEIDFDEESEKAFWEFRRINTI